jgi:hypothetical protein
MPDDVIAHFKTWIEMGAPDPRERQLLKHKSKITPEDIESAKSHWAFQKPSSRSNATIDSVISEGLAEAGLKPAPAADPMTLLRRLNYDLIGLPPTSKEISVFKKAWDKDLDEAVKLKTDELMARPQFGERWGRHWLDVARFAESAGVINMTFPEAWRYRDYVIESFNNDTPYDQFLLEQIAGDLLPAKTDEVWQKNLIATGFLAIGTKRLDERNPRIFDADLIDEQIDTVTQATLGMTVACARCHDHKFDPIPTEDYYAMAGIFQSTKTLYGTIGGQQNHRPSDLLLLPIVDKKSNSRFSAAQLESKLEQLQEQRLELLKGVRAGNERVRSDFLRLKNQRQKIEGELAKLNKDGTKKTFGMGVQEASEIANAHVLIGGEVDYQAQEVPRGFVSILSDVDFEVTDEKSSGRLELAKALTSTDNPLTARVMVNRIWMHLLGRPLVGTPNNFGLSGIQPDSQQLLDHLAVRFMAEDWSVKTLIREIVASDAYQRSSEFSKKNYAIDPDNTMVWRANQRTLDAESMRDTMLMIAGQLDLQPPSASGISWVGDTRFDRTGGNISLDEGAKCRSVYLSVVRNSLHESLSVFDFPEPTTSGSARSVSIVPTQALYVMNSEFVSDLSRAMAVRLAKQFKTTEEQVRNAFVEVYGRPATAVELKASEKFFREFTPPQQTAANKPAENSSSRRSERGSRSTGGMNSTRNGRRGNRQRATDGSGGRSRQVTTQFATPSDKELAKLSVFCQTLMASAEFRILN